MTTKAKEQDQITLIGINQLSSSAGNARKVFDPSEIIELAASIRKDGLIQPLTVRKLDDIDYVIIAGERRMRACRLINTNDKEMMKVIPCIIREYTDEEAEAVQLAENIHRKDLSPMEECEVFNKLFKIHKTVQRVSEIAGKTPNYVQSRMQLTNLDKVFQKPLSSGTLPIAQALIIAKLPADQQKELVNNTNAVDLDNKGELIEIVSVNELKKIIADKVYVPLNSAVFDLKDEKLNEKMGACPKCSYNTGANKTLFEDITDESHCMKGSCFLAKTWKHIKSRIKQLEAGEEKPIFIYEEDRVWGDPKKLVEKFECWPSCDFEISKTKKEGFRIAIVLQVEAYGRPKLTFGEELFVKKVERKKEQGSSSSRSSKQTILPDESPIEMRERRMNKRFDREDDLDKVEVRKLIMQELFKKEKLSQVVIQDAARRILEEAYTGKDDDLIYAEYKIKDFDNDKLFDKIKTESDLLKLILVCFAADNLDEQMTTDVDLTDLEFDDLLKAAKEYKIDIKKLHEPFVAKREAERKIELADLAAAKKRAKDREKKTKNEEKPKAKKAVKK